MVALCGYVRALGREYRWSRRGDLLTYALLIGCFEGSMTHDAVQGELVPTESLAGV